MPTKRNTSGDTPSPDAWLRPGTPSFKIFFPDLDERHHMNPDCYAEMLEEAQSRLKSLLFYTRPTGVDIEWAPSDDDCQLFMIRVATMGAGKRFDSSRSKPTTFLSGIATKLNKEIHRQAKLSIAIDGDALDTFQRDDNQLHRAATEELYDDVESALRCLSQGEIRALTHAFGPFLNHSMKVIKRPRRIGITAKTLPRILKIIAKLRANMHNAEQ